MHCTTICCVNAHMGAWSLSLCTETLLVTITSLHLAADINYIQHINNAHLTKQHYTTIFLCACHGGNGLYACETLLVTVTLLHLAADIYYVQHINDVYLSKHYYYILYPPSYI